MLRITKPTYDDEQAGILPISDVHNLLEVEGDQTKYLFEYLTHQSDRRSEDKWAEAGDLRKLKMEPPSRFANFSAILKCIAEETSWHIGLLNPTAQDKHIDTYYPVSSKHSVFSRPMYAYLYSPEDLYTAARVGVNATGAMDRYELWSPYSQKDTTRVGFSRDYYCRETSNHRTLMKNIRTYVRPYTAEAYLQIKGSDATYKYRSALNREESNVNEAWKQVEKWLRAGGINEIIRANNALNGHGHFQFPETTQALLDRMSTSGTEHKELTKDVSDFMYQVHIRNDNTCEITVFIRHRKSYGLTVDSIESQHLCPIEEVPKELMERIATLDAYNNTDDFIFGVGYMALKGSLYYIVVPPKAMPEDKI